VRILIHGLNFAPELVGVGKYTGEMAQWLAGHGHDVRAVSAPPFNPQWKVADGFSPWRYAKEDHAGQGAEKCAEIKKEMRAREPEAALVLAGSGAAGSKASAADGNAWAEFRGLAGEFAVESENGLEAAGGRLRVLRCPLWVPRRPSGARRILHLASFAAASFPAMLRQIAWKPDLVLVIEPTLFCLPAAWMVAKLCGASAWLHVQDFEADAGFELGLVNSVSLRKIVAWAEKRLISGFGRVSTISEKMLVRLEQKGVCASACRLFPNWVDTEAIFPLAEPSPVRAGLGIARGEIVALYAGTMGHKQGLEVLADAAERLAAHAHLHFVFCGEGSGKSALLRRTADLPNVDWLPLQPIERLNDLLNLADIHLLPQRADAADLVMPSKLTGMFASGRPVVATARPETQLARAVEGRGMVVDPGDPAAFVDAVEQLTNDPAQRQRLGRSARDYALYELEKELVLSRFEKELLSFVATG
jgi:colanic acid biosynthesis glycosyl transferase WcaI